MQDPLGRSEAKKKLNDRIQAKTLNYKTPRKIIDK